jgi:hypothetical protein
MMFRKNLAIVVLIGLASGLVLSEVLFHDKPPRKEVGYYDYPELWLGEPDIKYAPLERLWFLHEESDIRYEECVGVADRIVGLAEENASVALRNIIYLPIPDVYSNSVYLLVADATPEVKQEILDIVDAPENVTICFIDAPASREMMLKWLNHLLVRLEGLEGFKGLMPDGRLYVGLREVTPGNVRAVLRALDGYVPPGLLLIRKDTM